MGKILSEGHKRKIGTANKGRRIPYKPRPSRQGKPTWNKGKKGSQIGNWKGKKRPELSANIEWRRKLSEALKGDKSPMWRGGITKESMAIRNSLEYKLWRESVFKRDNWTCVWCGVRSAKEVKVILNADHIKPFSLFPELRFAIDNGRTLCVDCHKTTDTYMARARFNKNRAWAYD